jgi:hypothetical protein
MKYLKLLLVVVVLMLMVSCAHDPVKVAIPNHATVVELSYNDLLFVYEVHMTELQKHDWNTQRKIESLTFYPTHTVVVAFYDRKENILYKLKGY